MNPASYAWGSIWEFVLSAALGHVWHYFGLSLQAPVQASSISQSLQGGIDSSSRVDVPRSPALSSPRHQDYGYIESRRWAHRIRQEGIPRAWACLLCPGIWSSGLPCVFRSTPPRWVLTRAQKVVHLGGYRFLLRFAETGLGLCWN